MAGDQDFSASAVADNVEAALRVLAYATSRAASPGLRGPSEVYAVIGALAESSATVRQITRQLAGLLDRELQADRIGVDEDVPTGGAGDPLGAVAAATAALDEIQLVGDQL